MSVNITWEVSGSPTSLINHGNIHAGNHSPYTQVTIQHNGSNPITNCKLYLTSQLIGYSGSFTPTSDLTGIISWGDQMAANNFGGLAINFTSSGVYPTVSGKNGNYYNTFRTGVGDVSTDGIILSSHMTSVPVMPVDGTIPVCSGVGQTWPSFYLAMMVPANGVVLGTQEVQLNLGYTYTS